MDIENIAPEVKKNGLDRIGIICLVNSNLKPITHINKPNEKLKILTKNNIKVKRGKLSNTNSFLRKYTKNIINP